MKKGISKVINTLLLAGFVILLLAGANSGVDAQEKSFFLPELQPSLSVDGLTLYNGVPPLVVVADPNPYMQGIKVPGPTAADALAAPEAAASTFSITYVAAGGTDPWDAVCVAFPTEAKTAFNAAAAIWANKLQSTVPIKIRACWSDLGSTSGILGYSGGAISYRNFTGAPKADVWYESSLANSIYGSDLDAASFDMNITYNEYFDWYYGTDGNPPAGQYDLVTVATHEMAHGLNFSGTASYSGGTGSYGGGAGGFPNIYDTFMENGAEKAVTTYANPSTALGTLFTSNDLWFDGPNAKAGNGGTRVKMYAPSPWKGGSSYPHLDYNTFKGTVNNMMVFAVAPGAANHDPGPVTSGLLKDLGWKFAGGTSDVPTPQSPSGNITDKTPTYKWTKVTGAAQYRFQLVKGTTTVYTKTVASSACGATTCTNTPTTALVVSPYKWKVQAKVGVAWKAYSAFKTFTVKAPVPTTGNVKVINGSSSYSITELYISPSSSSTWGANQLSSSIPAGGSHTVTNVPPDTYDLKAVFSNGSTYTKFDFTVSAGQTTTITATSTSPGPKAGLWEGSGMEFYVTPDQANVDNFAIAVDVYVGGVYCDTIIFRRLSPLVPITNKNFSFTGSFYASGTFDTSTASHGTTGLNSFSTSCGSVTGGPWNWTATWTDNSQPTIAAGVSAASVIAVPASKGHNSFTVNID